MDSIFDPSTEEVERYLAEARELARVIYADEPELAQAFMENANPKTLGTHGYKEAHMSPENLIEQEGMRGYVVVEQALIEVAKSRCSEIFSEAVEAFGSQEEAATYLFARNKDFDRQKPIVVASGSGEGRESVRQNMGWVARMRAA